MIPATDIVTSRFQRAILAAILFQGLQFVATPTIGSAAEQEMPRRHSLIQHPAVQSAPLPATTYETVLQSPGAEPAHITSGIEPHKPSVSPTPLPAPHHRTLTKRPAIATITAPATSPQTPSAASISGVTDGQAVQAPADTTKSATPTATAPTIKVTAPTHPGTTPAATATVAPTGPSPPVGTAGVQVATSAGDGSTPSSSRSRSASNLLKNPAIMSLLQPPAPVVTTPPSLPPPSTPPSTPPSSPPPPSPPSPSTANVTFRWTANKESDLAGYKIYIGSASGTYNFPGSPFQIGKVTSYTISNLPKGQTYFFALSAYDSAGNESVLSAEISKSLY